MPVSVDVPPGLESLKPYLQRSNEVESRNPLVAYFCRTYAAQLGVDVVKSNATKEQTAFVIKLLDDLEADKEELKPILETGKTAVELFGLTMFGKAEQALRNGNRDKVLAKIFYSASIILDVCRQFGPLDDETEKKIKYARWRAAKIAKGEFEGEFEGQDSPVSENSGKETFPSTETMKSSQSSVPQPPTPQPPVPPMNKSSITPPSIQPPAPQPPMNKASIAPPSSMGSSAPSNLISPPPMQPLQPTKPSTHTSFPSQTTPSTHSVPSSASNSTFSNNIFNTNSSGSLGNKGPSSAPTLLPSSSSLGAKSSKSSYLPSQNDVPDEAVDEAQKLTKFALSALQFYDVPAAIQNLRAALEKLGHPC